MGGFMRKTTKKTATKVAKKIDGRTKEGRALKARAAARKDKKDGREFAKVRKTEVKPKRKYTRRAPTHQEIMGGFKTAKPEATPKTAYTEAELTEAKSYFDNARSEVRSRVSRALTETPRDEWDRFTHIDVNGSLKKFKTEVVAAALGV
jgi:hypothetical protein